MNPFSLKTIISTALVLFALAMLFTPAPSYSQVPFGGPIVFIFPTCVEGIWVEVGPPTPGSFMWTSGTVTYSYGPPSHLGQYLLGMASGFLTCHVPCHAGLCPIGGGLLILFHGSSL